MTENIEYVLKQENELFLPNTVIRAFDQCYMIKSNRTSAPPEPHAFERATFCKLPSTQQLFKKGSRDLNRTTVVGGISVLCFTESEQPKQAETSQSSAMQSQMQTRMQMRTQIQMSSRLPQYLLKCLKPQNGQDDVHANFAQLLSNLNKADVPYALSLANRLYGKIKDVLVQGVLDDMTRLVLVNAIYFKGNWNEKFKEEHTVDAQFRINKNDTKPVKMMKMKSKFPFTEIADANLQILELPYEGKDLSMLIFLPNEMEDDTTGLEKLEKELTYEKFVEWTRPDMMSENEVQVELPRFKMEEKYNLKDVLISMGMMNAFDVTMSDFSGMSPANDLVLSKVVHKAFVEVNEEGTEAAAATAAVVVNRSLVIPVVFVADHPFLFFIRHNPTMSILFTGRYCSPE
ncbi:Leukocyte elastase inhibitor [Nibea albiflora]|uniref:Leukocyte elastase inhibitor n=1 Tax=Nibea albiflora TaxID=240163 RepID=A0ACB7F4M2_NIBAL|nr:Leukocyte elastase inhibitor [Nibea albiflora]